MKHFPNKAFPYPVLSTYSDDYVERRFQATLKWTSAVQEPILQARFELSDEALLDLIREENAAYVVEIHCLQTFNRIVRHTFKSDARFEFEKGDFFGDVEVNSYIVGKKDIGDFRSPNFHKDFGEGGYDVREGDVLAVYPPQSYWFDTDVHKPIGDFFYLLRDENDKVAEGRFKLDFEDNKIYIITHPDDHKRITIARSQASMKPWLLMALYFPALLEILHAMRKDPEEYESRKWYRAIDRKLQALEPPVDIVTKRAKPNLLLAAQRLLGDPLGRVPFMKG